MEKTVEAAIGRVRERVVTKTLIQDMAEPLTGQLDGRRIAARFNNLEVAVSDLADAAESINGKVDGAAGTQE